MLTPVSLVRAVLVAVVGCLLAAPMAAAAGDPIMPLSDVRSGMACTGYTVVRGVDIASFDVRIEDIVDDPSGQTLLLMRISGPAVDETGAGPGFSGSPIYCPGDDGVMRVAAALSEGLGEYGNKLVLGTPIEQVLAEPVQPPASTRHARRTVREARPLLAPLSLSGLSPTVAGVFQRAAAKVGRVLYAAPAAPRTDFPYQQLRPGSAMSAGMASGPIAASAIGTVTYVDGDSVWAFGHPLDSVGARALFLQDAYVYAVVSNPVGSPDLSSYKLAAPGHDVGTLTGDGIAAVTGVLGVLPPRYPLTVTATDLDTQAKQVTNEQLADERAVGLPTGTSALSLVGTATVAQAAYAILHGSPVRESGSMCVDITAQERPQPMRFCNTYVGAGAGSAGGEGGSLLGAAPVADFTTAATLIDRFELGPLHVTGVNVELQLRRGLSQAFLDGGHAPHRVRRGHDARVQIKLLGVGGARSTRTFRVHVPRGMPTGERELVLTGTPSDAAGGALSQLASLFDGSGGGSSDSDEGGPRSLARLARAIAAIHRYDGVTASFRPPQSHSAPIDPPTAPEALPPGPEGVALRERPVYRDPQLRISGTLRLRVFVSP
jgi:hypothetical protein